MVHYLSVALLRHQKMEQNDSKERTFDKDEHCTAAKLNYSDIEDEEMPHNGDFNIVIKIPNTNKLLAGIFLNESVPYFLPELPGEFLLMFEHLSNVGIVCPFPLCFP